MDSIRSLITDRVGVCIRCGALSDPVETDALAQPCEACNGPFVVGLIPALELGAMEIVNATVQ